MPGFQAVPLKTSPSAGALHPIEAYVLALRVKNLPRGIYHYAADTHRLELLRTGATGNQLCTYLAGQSWFRAAGFVVFMTAVFARTQWKYDTPRSYRVVLVEAGHLCQTFCILATWLGLAPFCTLALADSVVENALGVDGVSESVVYAAGAGTRPSEKD
jgi:SagB-type dehydrogenase family enzyme